jgi:proteasome lid subunit RPN8/RPN11
VIVLGEELVAAIHEHGQRAYPEECCGALLGSSAGGAARVERIRPIDNVREDERQRRFLVDPRDYLAAEREARGRGLELLGFYHSHPDHPAEPSRFDRLHAWPNLHYVILAVAAGEPRELTSWLLTEDRSAMRPERVVVAPPHAIAVVGTGEPSATSRQGARLTTSTPR